MLNFKLTSNGKVQGKMILRACRSACTKVLGCKLAKCEVSGANDKRRRPTAYVVIRVSEKMLNSGMLLYARSSYQRHEIPRSELVACKYLFCRWQFEDDSQHRRQCSMTGKDLIIKQKVLKFSPLNCHKDNPMDRRHGRNDPLRP